MLHSSSSSHLVRLALACSLLFSLLGPVVPAAAQRAASPSAQAAAVVPDDAVTSVVSPTALPSPTATPEPGPNGEIVALRNRTSRTYATAQENQTILSTASVNYPDANGTWQPIDNTLVASTTSGYAS